MSEPAPGMVGSGRVVLAATPLGRPDDASARLRAALASAGVIAAEDTRRLHRLCRDLAVEPAGRIVSFFDANESGRDDAPGEPPVTVRPVPGPLAHGAMWQWPAWLSDGRRLLVRGEAGLAVLDASTGAGHAVMPIPGYSVGTSVGLSRDNKWITYTETATEGDIWIATIRK